METQTTAPPASHSAFAFSPRIVRTPHADFWNNETGTILQGYTDDYLRRIADHGMDAIWMHCLLRETVPTALFGKVSPKPLDTIRRLVDRAARHGIRLYLFVNEPRGLPSNHPFWKTHEHVRGQPVTFGPWLDDAGTQYALCTSSPAVREFLEDGFASLFRKVPSLGGLIMITASEAHSHCYSHYPRGLENHEDINIASWGKAPFECPRCAPRKPAEVVAELIRTIRDGVRSASPTADLIAWGWSWIIIEPDPQVELIGMLPKDVSILSDWERGGSKYVCGKRYPLDEYSFSYVGPSPLFKRRSAVARANGLRVLAKLQIGTTHELAAVPYLPLPVLLAKKLAGLRRLRVDGYLGCWIFGGAVSPMTKLAGAMSRAQELAPAQAVRDLARSEFHDRSAPAAVRAWNRFADAWKRYPFSISLLYYGPMNYAVAHPLSFNASPALPTACHLPLPRDSRGRLDLGDTLDHWITPFTAPQATRAFNDLLGEWSKGVRMLDLALRREPGNVRLSEERNLARYIALAVESTVDIIRFFVALRALRRAKTPRAKSKERARIAAIYKRQIPLAEEARDLVRLDPRLGYHPEAVCSQFTPDDLDFKIRSLKAALPRLPR
ncbi:MAG: hypothetical protein V2A58_01235 [Planctomycetota bacterium]